MRLDFRMHLIFSTDVGTASDTIPKPGIDHAEYCLNKSSLAVSIIEPLWKMLEEIHQLVILDQFADAVCPLLYDPVRGEELCDESW